MSERSDQPSRPERPAADSRSAAHQPAAPRRSAPVARVVAPPASANAAAPITPEPVHTAPQRGKNPPAEPTGSRSRRSPWREPKVLASIAAAFVLLAAVGLWFGLYGQGNGTARDNARNTPSAQESLDPRDIPLPTMKTGEIQVFTTPPGFMVLVDGEPVRSAENPGEFLLTPCSVTVPRGLRMIRVAKEGYFDASEASSVGEGTSVVQLTPTEDSAGDKTGVMHAPYFNAEVGKPIPLESLNTPGREFDPFVTEDGLAIWFAAERAEGSGIFSATRSNPFEEFGAPQLARLSAGIGDDLPGSPSVSADGQLVAFCVPRKARIRGLTRSDTAVLGDFDQLVEVRYSESPEAFWPAAQLVADPEGGRAKVYWTEIDRGQTANFVATRPGPRSPFGDLRKLTLPGGIPCLSTDGLRQYVFDGKRLQRARRADPDKAFSKLETISELDLPDYKPNPRFRQYFVSFDEQWMFYCPDPESRADLYIVRLSKGPGWGYVATGRPIDGQQIADSAPPPVRSPFAGLTTLEVPDRPRTPSATPAPSAPPRKDPRATPLPYTAHWEEFVRLLRERKHDEAAQLVEQHERSPEFAAVRGLLAWDREIIEAVRGFWEDVRAGIRKLQPGEEYRQSGITLTFARLEGDMLVGTFRGSEVSKSIFELQPSDLLAHADRAVPKTDPAGRKRMALFLSHDGQAGPQHARLRFDPEVKAEYEERLATRLLRQAELEIERDNSGPALALLQRVRSEHPESDAAKRSRAVEDSLYERGKWRPQGGRQWQRGPLGEFTAAPQRAPGSYLAWPEPLEQFELRMEWKVASVPTAFGGVYFRYNPLIGDPAQPNASFKVQLGNDYGVAPDPTVSGGLFLVEAPLENAVKPAGQWNDFRLRVKGNKVDVWINGNHVLDTVTRNDQIPLRGGVLLDGISGGISYRKILLSELVE